MEEAEYCDRVVIMAEGRVLAQGAPAEIRGHARPRAGHAPTMEDAFIAIVENARASTSASNAANGKSHA
jgi:ABC-2 type transport system ATP-binding protein